MIYQIDAQEVDIPVPGFEEFTFHNTGAEIVSWQIRGTDGTDRVHAGDTRGTTFDALGGDDIMWGSSEDDVYDGGPGDDQLTTRGQATTSAATSNSSRIRSDLRHHQPLTQQHSAPRSRPLATNCSPP